MDIELARLAGRLSEVARDLHRRGWCLGTAGNFSVRVSGEPLRLLVTRSGRHKSSLSERDFVVVDSRGVPLEASGGDDPSAEAALHGAILEITGTGAVLHTHSVAGTLMGEQFAEAGGFTIGGYEMLKGLPGIDSHEVELFVPVLPNSQNLEDLSRRVATLLSERPDCRGFLLGGHGLYTWGSTLTDARGHVEILEFLLECLSRRVRFRPFEG